MGGAERQLGILAAAQVRAGEEVHIAHVHGGVYLKDMDRHGVKTHAIKAAGNHDPRIALGLARLFRRLAPDIVQTWLPQMDVFAGAAALLTSVPWVLLENSSAPAYVARLKDRLIRPAIGGHASAIVANSPDGLDYWADRGKSSAVRAVIPNALDFDRIRAATPTASTGMATERDPYFLYAGRLSPEKNLPVLIRAFRLAYDQTGVGAVICGEGPMRAEAAALIATLDLEGKVVLAGVREDVWGLMKGASALVSASLFEGQSNVVLEGAAAGVPLVLSDIKGNRDAADDLSALFFDARSHEELAVALVSVVRDPSAAAARTDNARRGVEGFSIERCVTSYRLVYDQLLARAS